MDNAEIGCSKVKTFYHKSPITNHHVASVTGVDVNEACDGYSGNELRAIARYLENIADHLDYRNTIEDTKPLFEMRV